MHKFWQRQQSQGRTPWRLRWWFCVSYWLVLSLTAHALPLAADELSQTVDAVPPTIASPAVVSPVVGQVTPPPVPVVRLTSLEWPPYTSVNLPDGGMTVAVVKAAFAKAGYRLEVDFFPWQRAKDLARSADSPYIGYFPSYVSPERRQQWLMSDSIGSGPLGFAYRRDSPLLAYDVSYLQVLRLGLVSSYSNMKWLDDAVTARQLSPVYSSSDLDNLTALSRGAVDTAVIDFHVYQYWLIHQPELFTRRHHLQFSASAVELKELAVVFVDGKTSPELRDAFNQGLAQVDIEQMMRAYMVNLRSHALRGN